MAIARATVVLESMTNKPVDAARNVWHFSTPDFTTANINKIVQGLAAFYSGALASQFGASVKRTTNAHRVEVAEVTPGGVGEGDDVVTALLATHPFTIATAASGVSYPPEVACALSFRGDVVGLAEEEGLIRPKSRRRGRVYLGPLTAATSSQQTGTNVIVVADAFRQLVVDQYLLARAARWDGGPTGPQHVVYSRQGALVSVVKQLHVDDAYDTIRSRGVKSTLRTILAVA